MAGPARGAAFYALETHALRLMRELRPELEALEHEDPITGIQCPASMHRCVLEREDDPVLEGVYYTIKSKGPLRGEHVTSFRSRGAHAQIEGVYKWGLIDRTVKTPIERHVDVLRSLGYRYMTYPDERCYEIKAGIPGVRRVR